jgi:hypothetical protein
MKRLRLSTYLLLIALPINASGASSFYALGCLKKQIGSRSVLDCSQPGLEERFNCIELEEVSADLKPLYPTDKIARCYFEQKGTDRPYIIYHGCGMLLLHSTYIIIDDHNELIELSTRNDLAKQFSPIESGDEALAYTIALTGLKPNFAPSVPTGYVKLVEELVPSFSKPTVNGFVVRLFGFECAGCGPHPYFFIDFKVTTGGQLQQAAREDVYKNPLDDNRCYD